MCPAARPYRSRASADSPLPRDAAEQRRHFRAGLREAEDVVDEEQHVLALISEIFGDQSGEADASASAGRLVHLAEHQRAL
jgi:hypothetical protein